ncbi:MAG: response regulator [Hyphomicrobiaceae bacterium]
MPDQEQLRILVVDDEATQRILAKDYLEDAGHVVRPVEDGARAIKMAERSKPDIILLDILLPHVDGFTICEQIKSNPETANTPIILITASREPDVIEKGLAAGADDFITKPVDWEFLTDRVVNVVKRARERAEMERLIHTQQAASIETPMPSGDGFDDQLEALIETPDLQIELANETIAAERERARAEATEEISQEIERVRAESAAEIQALRKSHAEDIEGIKNALRLEYVEQINNLKQDHKNQLENYVEQVLAARQSEITALNNEHSAELEELRNGHMLELEAQRTYAEQDLAIAAKRQTAELQSLKNALQEEAELRQKDFDTNHGEPSGGSDEARIQAAWRMAQNWGNTHQSLARAIVEKAKSAGETPEIRDIQRTATTLSHTLGKMKIFSEAMSASSEIEETPVQLSELIESVAQETQAMARERRVVVNTQPIDPDIFVNTDAKRIRYVLISLLVNAIRYTPADGRVELKVRTDENGATIFDIVDSGVGIAPSKISELLNCLDAPSENIGVNPSEGTGFGWPIATALTRRMGGTLDLESRLGMGSRVSIGFPAEKRSYPATENSYLAAN